MAQHSCGFQPELCKNLCEVAIELQVKELVRYLARPRLKTLSGALPSRQVRHVRA
jgi:hypothetical protein